MNDTDSSTPREETITLPMMSVSLLMARTPWGGTEPHFLTTENKRVRVLGVLSAVEMSDGNPVRAIKLIRALTDVSLKEAKDMVDTIRIARTIGNLIN